jgi:hypothetical protein
MPIPRPTPEQACGARNRHGEPCKNWPARISTSVKRRCRFHGGRSITGMVHPSWRHGYRSRLFRELGEMVQKGARFSMEDAILLTRLVRDKRAELTALVRAIEGIKMESMTDAEIRAYLGLPLSPCDVVIRKRHAKNV